MSKLVAVELQVAMVATPDTVGVHLNTASGEALVLPQVPVSELAPLVTPVKVPPAAGIVVGEAQLPEAMVVEVVEPTIVLVVEVVAAVVLVVEAAVVLVVECVVEVVLDVAPGAVVLVLLVDVLVDPSVVEVVVAPAGGVMLRLKLPACVP